MQDTNHYLYPKDLDTMTLLPPTKEEIQLVIEAHKKYDPKDQPLILSNTSRMKLEDYNTSMMDLEDNPLIEEYNYLEYSQEYDSSLELLLN
jgi:hypothetical protein